AVAGVKFVYVAAAVLGAAGAYLWLRAELAGASRAAHPAGAAWPALVGSAAFAFSPYLMAAETHLLGHAPQLLALALAPWAFFAFGRLRRAPSAGRLALAGLALAALLLAHNLMPVIFLALLIAWLAWPAPAASPAGL